MGCRVVTAGPRIPGFSSFAISPIRSVPPPAAPPSRINPAAAKSPAVENRPASMMMAMKIGTNGDMTFFAHAMCASDPPGSCRVARGIGHQAVFPWGNHVEPVERNNSQGLQSFVIQHGQVAALREGHGDLAQPVQLR